ncbi:M20 family metallopeptidase [Archaeoglobus sulfaticallidus]|nr:M20/M25/M40 family metallo-hydrolase [Archaeoglobus sulfaticallidus]
MLNKLSLKIENKEKRYIDILKELVKKESLSGREGRIGEDSIANLVWEYVNDIGVSATFHEVDNSHNIVCEVGEGERCIVFSAHMDTVSAGDYGKWLTDPFGAEEGVVRYLGNSAVEVEVCGKRVRGKIRDQMDRIWKMRKEKEKKIIYGRGSFDNKASVAILLFLLDILGDIEMDGKIYAVFTVREEVDAEGIKHFIKTYKRDFDKFRERYAVVLEGSYSFMPVIAHRGVCWAYIRTYGKRCHASTPHLGRNAVVEMCRIVDYLEANKRRIIDELYEHSEDRLLGKPTFSITSIVGGGIRKVVGGKIDRIDLNVIPDFCESSVDIRYGRGITAELIHDFFTREIKKVSQDFEFTVEEETFYPSAGIGNSFDDAMEDDFVKAVMESSGINQVGIAPGASEGAFLHSAGFKTLVEFGPAGAFSHDAHEYVEIDEIKRGVKVTTTLLNKMGFV